MPPADRDAQKTKGLLSALEKTASVGTILNQCLKAGGAKYRAQFAVIRRSEVMCPQTPTNQ